MKTLSILCTALALVGVATGGCKKQGGAGAANATEVVIGEYASITGPTASFGVSSNEGTILAVEEANAAGGVLGKPIRVVTYDNRSDASEAVTAVQKLISSDRVCAILGEVASKRSLAGAQPCQKNGIPMVSPASTNPAVTEVGDYIFRVCFTDDFQGKVCAQFGQKKGWKKVAIFTDVANDYSKGLTRVFKEVFPAGGGQIVSEETYREGDKDFKGQLAKMKAAGVDAVFVPGYYTDVGNILRQARQIELRVTFFGADGWDDPKTFTNLGSIADGCYFTNHYAADDKRPEVQAFITA